MSEVSESINTVLKHLEVLGLTPNQSKVIVSMSKLGTADANTVVIESGVPRAKIYGILSELVNLDLIEKDKVNDRLYNYKGTDHIITTLKTESLKYTKKILEAAEKSENILKEIEETSDKEPIKDLWIYEGLDNIIPYVESAVNSSSQSIYGSINSLILNKIWESLEKAHLNHSKIHLFIEKHDFSSLAQEKSGFIHNCITFEFSSVQKLLFLISQKNRNANEENAENFLSEFRNFYENKPSFLIIDETISFIVLKTLKENSDFLGLKFTNPDIVRTQKNVIEWIVKLIRSFLK